MKFNVYRDCDIYAVLAYRIIAELFKSVKQFFKIPL